jgi:hypothetical protein
MKTWTPSTGNYRRDAGTHIPSKPLTPPTQAKPKAMLSDDMMERERIAQVEIEHKKKCLAPAYNKGAYQPVWTEDQAKDVGR